MVATPLVVIGSEGPRPFMRGIMVQSLVSRGIPFDVAVDTANKIVEQLGDRGRVERAELATLVERLLAERYDLEAVPARAPVPTVRSASGSATPFSKGILSVSLQGAALDPNDAYGVACEIEARFESEGRHEIERSALRELVSETIERTHGSHAAERYRTWRRALEEGRPIFILIGGTSGVGKSSVAVETARRLELAGVMGTDAIRQIMRLMFSPDLMPEIHCSTYDAYQVLRLAHAGARDPLILGYREQAQRVAVGVHGLLDRALQENTSMVIEGVNLLPGLLQLDRYREGAHVVFLAVAALDAAAFRDRFRARGAVVRERAPDRYLEHIDAILAIQDYILSEADHFGLPIIDNVHFDETVRSAIRTVIATIQKAAGAAPVEAMRKEASQGGR